jgi:hypothetical protein
VLQDAFRSVAALSRCWMLIRRAVASEIGLPVLAYNLARVMNITGPSWRQSRQSQRMGI